MTPLTLRHRLNLSQTAFWSRVHVTQSGGSRYETGRRVPKHILTLIEIAYGSDRDAARAVRRLRG